MSGAIGTGPEKSESGTISAHTRRAIGRSLHRDVGCLVIGRAAAAWIARLVVQDSYGLVVEAMRGASTLHHIDARLILLNDSRAPAEGFAKATHGYLGIGGLAMRAEARLLVEWFDIVAGAMKNGREIGVAEVRDHFASSGESLDGKLYDASDPRQRDGITRSLEIALPWFERWRLIEAREDRDRYTPSLRLHNPRRVARLSKRGRWLAQRSPFVRRAIFRSLHALVSVRRWFNPFRTLIAVAGVCLVVLRIWDTFGLSAAVVVLAVARDHRLFCCQGWWLRALVRVAARTNNVP